MAVMANRLRGRQAIGIRQTGSARRNTGGTPPQTLL
jgi:hypothetical protein